MAEVRKLVEEYRDRCLWFLRRDFVPSNAEEALRVLDLIERAYGCVVTRRRVGPDGKCPECGKTVYGIWK
jgi:hypothetical protein